MELCEKIKKIVEFYKDDEEIQSIELLSDPPSLLRITIQITHGPTHELGKEKNMYPFTEYIRPHKILIHLPLDYPERAPDIIWETKIPHPNIVPNQKNHVCNNYIKKRWADSKSFSFVVRTLTETLRNPNPWEPYVNDDNKESIRICQEMGFPKAFVEEPEKGFVEKFKEALGTEQGDTP